MNVKKDILKPVLITVAVLIAVATSVFLIFHFCFPHSMGQLCYKIGLNKQALHYFESSFNKSQNYNELYNLVNLSIKVDNNQKIVEYYEKLSSDANYNSLILQIDTNNKNLQTTNLVKSKLHSEDNYLKNRYVLAMAKLGDKQKAFNYALSNTSFNASHTPLSPYCFTYIANQTYFYNEADSQAVFNNMCNYFTKLCDLFDVEYKSPGSQVNALAIGGRINEVATNIKELRLLGYSNELTDEQINQKIYEVNQIMPSLY